MMFSQKSKPSLHLLPKEVLLNIFLFLPNRDQRRLLQVCKDLLFRLSEGLSPTERLLISGKNEALARILLNTDIVNYKSDADLPYVIVLLALKYPELPTSPNFWHFLLQEDYKNIVDAKKTYLDNPLSRLPPFKFAGPEKEIVDALVDFDLSKQTQKEIIKRLKLNPLIFSRIVKEVHDQLKEFLITNSQNNEARAKILLQQQKLYQILDTLIKLPLSAKFRDFFISKLIPNYETLFYILKVVPLEQGYIFLRQILINYEKHWEKLVPKTESFSLILLVLSPADAVDLLQFMHKNTPKQCQQLINRMESQYTIRKTISNREILNAVDEIPSSTIINIVRGVVVAHQSICIMGEIGINTARSLVSIPLVSINMLTNLIASTAEYITTFDLPPPPPLAEQLHNAAHLPPPPPHLPHLPIPG